MDFHLCAMIYLSGDIVATIDIGDLTTGDKHTGSILGLECSNVAALLVTIGIYGFRIQ